METWWDHQEVQFQQKTTRKTNGGNEKKCEQEYIAIAGQYMSLETQRAKQASYFLNSVCDAHEKREQWTAQLRADSIAMEFKMTQELVSLSHSLLREH